MTVTLTECYISHVLVKNEKSIGRILITCDKLVLPFRKCNVTWQPVSQ